MLMGLAETDPEGQEHYAAFRERLYKLGWTEGANIRRGTGRARLLVAIRQLATTCRGGPSHTAVAPKFNEQVQRLSMVYLPREAPRSYSVSLRDR